MVPRVGLACVLVVAAGCAGPLAGGTPTEGTLPEPSVHPGTTADVDVQGFTTLPVRITVTELGPGGRGVVVDETYTDRSMFEFDRDAAFREDADYRVVVRVNGTVRWNRTVRHYEFYELRVGAEGNVTVLSHAVA